ncbi:MAG: thioether cross-link-forming SCIFF peptide maturase [Peptococcaceae bacterium]|nr:thioether cross-link-forming SCIFF peptide maturase [Peptococcaceae bacterium]
MRSLDLKNYPIASHVHLYRQGGMNIAYDVNSGSLHLLDDMTFAYIGEWSDYQKAFPQGLDRPESMLAATGHSLNRTAKADILRELAELQAEDLLFSRPVVFEGPETPQRPQIEIKAICLHVAHDCNLRCGYCFAGTGPFGGGRGLMSLEVGKKALDFVVRASGVRKHCEVDFFGGEPLLNWPVVRDLVGYGRELEKRSGKTIKFTMTTNGVLFTDEVQDFVEKEHISLVLSLDGRQETHDRMRVFCDGSGSYEAVVDRVSGWMRRHAQTSRYAMGTYSYVRGTYTRHNLDFYRDVLHMADLGIERISLEPVVASSGTLSDASPGSPSDGECSCSYGLTREHVEALCESYDILGEEARKGNFTFFHFNAGLAGPCLPKRLSGCGAGYEYVAVSPEGDLYPCHQFVGQEAFKMGSLFQDSLGGLTEKATADLAERFRQTTVYSKAACRGCWARFSCSGGCHASNVAHGGALDEVYVLGCALQKKRLEVAYYLQICEAG